MKVCPKCGKQFSDDANFCPTDAGRLVAAEETATPASGDAGSPASQPAVTPARDAAGPAPVGASRVMGDRFELIARIGGTFTGEIFRATDRKNGRTCVVKLVDPAVFPTPVAVQRTERELRQLERIQSPGIVKIFAHGSDGDRMWIATEYVAESQSLNDVIFDHGPMDAVRASKVVLEIGKSLADAAKVGVIHRDLAPKNVLLGPRDAIKIINFGVAMPGTGKVQGVPEFVAPEMVEGKLVDQRANIYSLGAVYYFLVTGRTPYVGEPEEVLEQHRKSTVAPPSTHLEVPEAIDLVICKALERTSSKRFMTLRQLLSALEPLARGELDPEVVLTTQPMSRLGQGAGKGKDKNRKLSSTMLGGYGGPSGSGQFEQQATGKDGPGAGDSGSISPNVTMKMGSASTTSPPVTSDASGTPAASTAAGTAAAASAASPPAADPALPGSERMTAPMGAVGIAQAAPAAVAPAESPRAAAVIVEEPVAPLAQPSPLAALTGNAAAPGPAGPGTTEQAMPAAARDEGRKASPADTPARRQPAPAAPVAASPGRASQPGQPARAGSNGKLEKARAEKQRKSKGKFRETLWFKKGELDAAAAIAADTEETQHPEGDALGKADFMPLEDRYTDDGSLSVSDEQRFSLKTGGTESMPAMRGSDPSRSQQVTDRELIHEMKGKRGKMAVVIVVAVVVVVIAIGWVLFGG